MTPGHLLDTGTPLGCLLLTQSLHIPQELPHFCTGSKDSTLGAIQWPVSSMLLVLGGLLTGSTQQASAPVVNALLDVVQAVVVACQVRTGPGCVSLLMLLS